MINLIENLGDIRSHIQLRRAQIVQFHIKAASEKRPLTDSEKMLEDSFKDEVHRFGVRARVLEHKTSR